MFPYVGLPLFFQRLAELLPLTHFVRLARGILLKGASLGELWHELIPLIAFFLGVLALALIRFRERLD